MTAVQNDPNRMHTDGTKAGDLIPGSKLYRCFCPKCGDAIRFAAKSPDDALRRVAGKRPNSQNADKATDGNLDVCRFTPFCQECVDDGPKRESSHTVDDLFKITNQQIAEMPTGERKLMTGLSQRTALQTKLNGQEVDNA